MKTANFEEHQFVVRNPRLEMTLGGRLIVRIAGAVGYAVSAAATFTFLFSDVVWLRWAGVFLFLVLIDLLVHFGEADLPLSEIPKSGPVNPVRYTKPNALRAIERAYDRSGFKRTDFSLELMREFLRNKTLRNSLYRLDVDPAAVDQKIEEMLARRDEPRESEAGENNGVYGATREGVASLLVGAMSHAIRNGHTFINSEDVFATLSHEDVSGAKRIFHVFSIDSEDLDMALTFERLKRGLRSLRIPFSVGGFLFENERRVRHRIMNRSWTARPTPILDRYSVDLTDRARHGEIGFLIGHDKEYVHLVDTLARPLNPNALLIGEKGVGKEVIINHLAFSLIKDKVPSALFDKRLVRLDIGELVAGAEQSELHKRLQGIVREITMSGNLILYIPDIHNLVKTSGDAQLSVADALMPVITNSEFPIIGSAYPKEHKLYIESRSDFAHIFETIRVEEISPEESVELLVYESVTLEKKTNKEISFGAVRKAVELAKKYFHERPLPGSASDLLKDAVISADRKGEKRIGSALVIEAAEAKVNVPIHEAEGAEAESFLHLEDLIHKRLVNQEEAVKAVAHSLRSYRSGLTRTKGPIASFLFVGPTGVGKTELAKALAEILFGSDEAMVRFDMTEYQDVGSVGRFIGSPDGKVSGALTEAVREKPYRLILLDEFEKSNAQILNLFLQVFDDGRLTDSVGRTVDFTNSLIIATSNAHSDIINDALGKGQKMIEIAEYVKRRLVEVFQPELLNRFSQVVIFRDLALKEVEQVATFQLKGIQSLAEEKGIHLSFSPEAIRCIAKNGYDPSFGARPLRRVIEENVQAPLAELMLAKKATKGSVVRAEFQNDAVVLVVSST